jgi:hypothetical protein
VSRLYRTFLIALIISLAVPVAAIALVFSINLKPTLLPLENEVLSFSFRLPPPLKKSASPLKD